VLVVGRPFPIVVMVWSDFSWVIASLVIEEVSSTPWASPVCSARETLPFSMFQSLSKSFVKIAAVKSRRPTDVLGYLQRSHALQPRDKSNSATRRKSSPPFSVLCHPSENGSELRRIEGLMDPWRLAIWFLRTDRGRTNSFTSICYGYGGYLGSRVQ
jgi:hypothetical protein